MTHGSALYGAELRDGKPAAGPPATCRVKVWRETNVREEDVQEQARSRGRPRQAAGAQAIQQRPIGKPAWTAPENPPPLLVEVLNEKVVVTIDGKRWGSAAC